MTRWRSSLGLRGIYPRRMAPSMSRYMEALRILSGLSCSLRPRPVTPGTSRYRGLVLCIMAGSTRFQHKASHRYNHALRQTPV